MKGVCVCIYTSCSANNSADNTSFPSRAELAEAAALKEQHRRSEMAAAAAAAKARREQQAANASRVSREQQAANAGSSRRLTPRESVCLFAC
jgi:hypothetical protein